MKNIITKIIITWFGCGLVPLAPGTAGSLGTMPLAIFLLNKNCSVPLLVVLATALTIIAIFFVAIDQRTSTTKDPGYVVIDEAAGILWSISSLPLLTEFQAGISFSARQNIILVFCFVCFRIFDVLKPFPAGYFDAQSKVAADANSRGAHIVLDDVVAGIYTALLTFFVFKYIF